MGIKKGDLLKVTTATPWWDSNPQPLDWEPKTLTTTPSCSLCHAHTFTAHKLPSPLLYVGHHGGWQQPQQHQQYPATTAGWRDAAEEPDSRPDSGELEIMPAEVDMELGGERERESLGSQSEGSMGSLQRLPYQPGECYRVVLALLLLMANSSLVPRLEARQIGDHCHGPLSIYIQLRPQCTCILD